MPAVQWHSIDNGEGYTAVDRTVPVLPPGVYDIIAAGGNIYWWPLTNRTDRIIRFPETPIDEVVSEIQTFWAREQAFLDHGLPFKRGILLHGPPGSGKTSTLQLVARDVIDRGGIVALFTSPSLFVQGYRQFRTVQPDTPLVVLMEDLDEILTKQNQSSILNLLDGAESTHKVVFLATTNYPDRLDPRVINRPSRFDRRFLIGHPNEESRRLYLRTLVRDGDKVDIDRYAADTDGLSLAHVKELFVATVILGSDYSATLEVLRSMRERPSSFDGEPRTSFGQYA